MLAHARLGRPEPPAGPAVVDHRAFLEVLEALLWGFHNGRTGCASRPTRRSPPRPSARGARSPGAEALEWAAC
jgi:hypothetical protein